MNPRRFGPAVMDGTVSIAPSIVAFLAIVVAGFTSQYKIIKIGGGASLTKWFYVVHLGVWRMEV